MGKQYQSIPTRSQKFIKAQKLFFVATAAKNSRVNLSPKGGDSLRVLSENRVVWLNLTGSGNETAAHLLENDRMTLMFCAFEGKPMILRLYGNAKTYHPRDMEYSELVDLFPDEIGARQIIDMTVDLVQTSCGMSVPFYDFKEERNQLREHMENKGRNGVKKYWKDRNTMSIDKKPTGI